MKTRFYKILYKNKDVVYVGVTLRPITERFRQHIISKGLDTNYSVVEFDCIEHPEFTTLEVFYEERCKVANLEQKYIKEELEKGSRLLNISKGGEWGSSILEKLRKEEFCSEFGSYDNYKEYRRKTDLCYIWLSNWIINTSQSKLKSWLYHWIEHRNKDVVKGWFHAWVYQEQINNIKRWMTFWVKTRSENKTKSLLIEWVRRDRRSKVKSWLKHWLFNKNKKVVKGWITHWVSHRGESNVKVWVRSWTMARSSNSVKTWIKSWVTLRS